MANMDDKTFNELKRKLNDTHCFHCIVNGSKRLEGHGYDISKDLRVLGDIPDHILRHLPGIGDVSLAKIRSAFPYSGGTLSHDRVCANCQHARQELIGTDPMWLSCHKGSPSPSVRATDDIDDTDHRVWADWPMVFGHDWCSEHVHGTPRVHKDLKPKED